MSLMNQLDTGLQTRPLYIGTHVVHVRATFTGKRPPLVLVHGIGMSGEYFLPLTEVLTATHDVYALDLPGYGKTPKPDHALSVAELAEIVAETLSTLGLEAPVLVGHSMGSQIVTHVVAKYPKMCAGYIIIGPTVDSSARSLPAQGLRLLRNALVEPLGTNAVVLRNYLRMGPIRYLRTAQYMLDDHLEETIQRCTIPGLVVRGTRDPIAPLEWVRALAHLAPNAETAEIAGGPHAVQHNQPQELADACAQFLATINESQSTPQTIHPHP